MSKLLRALSVLGAGAGGVVSGMRMADRDREDEEEREFRRGQRARMVTQQAKEDRLQDDIGRDMTPRTVEPSLVRNDAADDRDVGLPGTQLEQRGYRMGGRTFGDQATAQTAADAENAPSMRMMRASNRYASAGKIAESEQFRQRGEALQREGALQFIQDIRTGMPNVQAIEQVGGAAPVAIPESARRNFDGAGKLRVPKGAQAQAFVHTFADGTKVPDLRILDENGKVLVASANTIEGIVGMSLAERQAAERGERQFGAQVKHQGRMADVAQQGADTSRLSAEANIAEGKERTSIARMSAGTAAANARRAAANDDARLVMARDEHELRKKALEQDARIPQAVKTQYATLDAELKQIGAAIAKAQAEGMFDPNQPGAQGLLMRQRELTLRATALLQPYLEAAPGQKRPPGEPMGPYPGAAAQAPAAAPTKREPPPVVGPSARMQPPAVRVASDGSRAPVDRVGDVPIGPETADAALIEAAQAGNKRAYMELLRRRTEAKLRGRGAAAAAP